MDQENKKETKNKRQLWQVLKVKIDFSKDQEQFKEWASSNWTFNFQNKQKSYSILKYKISIIFFVLQLAYLHHEPQIESLQNKESQKNNYLSLINLSQAAISLLLWPTNGFYYFFRFTAYLIPKILFLFECFLLLQAKSTNRNNLKAKLLQLLLNLSGIILLIVIYQALKPFLLIGERTIVFTSCTIFLVSINYSSEESLSVLCLIPLSMDEPHYLRASLVLLVLSYTRVKKLSKGDQIKNKSVFQILRIRNLKMIIILRIIVLMTNRQFTLLFSMIACIIMVELIKIVDEYAVILKYQKIKEINKLHKLQVFPSNYYPPSQHNWQVDLPIPEYN